MEAVHSVTMYQTIGPTRCVSFCLQDISENPVMVYMKGVPEAPQCGFSNTVVRLLEHHGRDHNP